MQTGTATLDHGGPWSNSKEGVLHILQNFRTGVSQLDGVVSYSEHLLGVSSSSVEMQSAHPTAPAN